MKVYLVGGAVRDFLLGREIKDRDFVVIGATVEEMLAQGFMPVGKHLPVFLHPKTKEEYALARTEKKAGMGYHGFTFYTSPEVSLEEDLKRRDLRINAMAQDLETGEIIDPYAGREDLKNRILSHVSEAFLEDPLRLFRVARFGARLAPLGFKIAPQTMALLKRIVALDELSALSQERIMRETERAFLEPSPSFYVRTLFESHAIQKLFPSQPQLTYPLMDLDSFQDLGAIGVFGAWFWSLVVQVKPPEALNLFSDLKERMNPSKQYKMLASLITKEQGETLVSSSEVKLHERIRALGLSKESHHGLLWLSLGERLATPKTQKYFVSLRHLLQKLWALRYDKNNHGVDMKAHVFETEIALISSLAKELIKT